MRHKGKQGIESSFNPEVPESFNVRSDSSLKVPRYCYSEANRLPHISLTQILFAIAHVTADLGGKYDKEVLANLPPVLKLPIMSEARRFLSGVTLLLVFSVSTVSFGNSTRQSQQYDPLNLKLDDKVLGSKYDVLGLKLGMNAEETRKIIGERFHVKEVAFGKNGYVSLPSTSRYVHGKTYTEQITLRVDGAVDHILCKFVEVAPGEGKGPEMLWSIYYTPVLEHTPDAQAFIDSVHQKFGKPNEETDFQGVWGDAAYTTPVALLRAGLPELELTANPGVGFTLSLSNDAIPKHMEAVFLSKKTTTPPI